MASGKERRLAALRKTLEGLQSGAVVRGEAAAVGEVAVGKVEAGEVEAGEKAGVRAAVAPCQDPSRAMIRPDRARHRARQHTRSHKSQSDLDGPVCDGPDWGLPAELPCGALNEVVAAYADRPAAFGFLIALTAHSLQAGSEPVLLVAVRRALSDFGDLYGHGLAQLGLDVDRLILVETKSDKDALWAIEETLKSDARPAMVAGALAGGLDLTSSRRLNLAAAPRRTPLVLLSGAKMAGTNAAAARWRIAAAPAARDRFGTFAAPRWHVALERCRLGSHRGRPGAWIIEWNHVAHRFRVAAGLADRSPVAGAGLRRAG
jgi:protein ImuA